MHARGCALLRGSYHKVMQAALKFMIIATLAFWAFLLLAQYRPQGFWTPRAHIDDATKNARCARYEQKVDDSEGDRVMGYGDRTKQFLSGCW